METIFQKIARPIKQILPSVIWQPLRRLVTALLQPYFFSFRYGHFRSSLSGKAIDRFGHPLPWYSYPIISLLQTRDFSDKSILEFGSGQSTLWWAKKAKKVISFEDDPAWYRSVSKNKPRNVELFLVSNVSAERQQADINKFLKKLRTKKFDVIIIDGGYRGEDMNLAMKLLSPGGAIIIDNSESYDTLKIFGRTDFQRVDFFGPVPGVILPNATSIFYREKCFLFSADLAVPGE